MSPAARGGRRMAVRPSRRPARPETSAVLAAALLLVAVAAGGIAARVAPTRPVDPAPAAPTAARPVESTLLGCPVDGPTQHTVGLAPPAELPPGVPTGTAGRLRVRPGSTPTVDRGDLADLGTGREPATLEGAGEAAVGLFGTAVSRADGALSVAGCVGPRGTWWFAGAGAGLDHASTLTLANLDPGPAVVDLRVLGPDGEVDTVGTRGIVVAPGEQRVLPLTEVAPANDELVVSVVASRGRVVAETADAFRVAAGALPGRAWLPGTDRPAETMLLAGMPDRADTRTLLVGNPSDEEALVDVEVAGASGSFVPLGVETLPVAPGAVAALDLTDAVPAGEDVAVRLRSSTPVVATVRSVRGEDVAYAGPAAPVQEVGVLPVPDGVSARVTVTALDERPARVRLAAYTADGRLIEEAEPSPDPTATAGWTVPERAGYVVVRRLAGAAAVGAGYTAGDPRRPTGVDAGVAVELPVRLRAPLVRPAFR